MIDKVIVATGHTGTIGRYLPATVIKPNWDLLLPESIKFPKNLDFDLIHLAGVVGESNVTNDTVLSTRINIDATRDLGKKFLEFSNGRFIYISSSHVYGRVDTCISEEAVCNPRSEYAVQKLKAENELMSIFKNTPTRLLILRVFSILDWNMPPGTLGHTIEKVLDGTINTLRNASDIRDFLTPKTVADTIYKIVKNYQCHGIINICSGKGISIRDAVDKFFLVSGITPRSLVLINEESKTPSTVGSNSKLLSLNHHEFGLSWDLHKKPNYSKNEN